MYSCIDTAIEDDVEIVYVLPTYTAVFDTRDYISKIVNRWGIKNAARSISPIPGHAKPLWGYR